jgi:hypothetical protein
VWDETIVLPGSEINRIREALLLCEVGITLECVENETAIDKTRSA